MGQTFSAEPVVEKETERDHNDLYHVAVSSCQGWRMSQEDNHSLILELPGEHKASFFAVYDGHGSAKVSKHASEVLWRHLTQHEEYAKGNFIEALKGAFLTFDQEVNENLNALLAGTTAVCLLIVDNIIYCANIGDSRGVASVNCECLPLSYDHKPENPDELKRIIKAGGYVLGNRINGNLALSRAFGDFHYKGNEDLPPEHQIVSPCPDIKTIELNDDVDFLVLACDGIWDVLSCEEVVDFVYARLEQHMEPGLICEELTTECLATDYQLIVGCDNMTVLLVCYTRGRSWDDYCNDLYNNNKNTRRIGSETERSRPRGIHVGSDEALRASHVGNEDYVVCESQTLQTESDSSPFRDTDGDVEDSPLRQSDNNSAIEIDKPKEEKCNQNDDTIAPIEGEQYATQDASSTDESTEKKLECLRLDSKNSDEERDDSLIETCTKFDKPSVSEDEKSAEEKLQENSVESSQQKSSEPSELRDELATSHGNDEEIRQDNDLVKETIEIELGSPDVDDTVDGSGDNEDVQGDS